MSNHHMLNLVSSDMDKEAHDMAAKHYGKKSVEEGTAADAEAGPEVMDPATQKMKDDADDETEVVDMLPTAAQDGGDKLDAAKKPAPANSSAALPKVAIVDAPTKLKESALNDDNEELEESVSSSSKVPHSVWGGDEGKKEHSDYMSKHHGVKTTFHRNDKLSYKGSRKALKSALKYHYGVEKFDNLKKDHPKLFKEAADSVTTNESTDSLEEQQDGTFYDGSDMLGEAQARYSDSYKFTHKPGDTESEKKLADLKAATKGSGNRVVLQGRLGKNNPNANKYSVKAGGGKSGGPVGRPPGQSGPHSHQRIAKADAAHHDVYVYRKA
jgi:hypothetical protein